MRAILFLLRKYLLPTKSGGLLTFALWISVAGVALGVTQLMVVLSVMSGFQQLFRDNYTKISSEIVVIPRAGRAYDPAFRDELEAIPGVAAVTPVSLGQGMVMKGNAVGGVTLEGIDVGSSGKVTPWESVWVAPPDLEAQKQSSSWIWLGKQLADKLDARVGDTVHVLLADGHGQRTVPFTVTGITKFGIYDHDLHHARIDLALLTQLFHREGTEPLYKTRVQSGLSLETVADRIREKLARKAHAKLWSEMNQNIFLAVEHQKQMLFLALEIIVALAAMNVVNLLMMSSHHRRRDVAILRAMGMRFRGVMTYFVAQGAGVGAVGVALGIAGGVVACWAVERFQPALLSESVYNVTRLPLRIEWLDVGLIALVGFLLCVVFSLIPAIGAARARPVDALRWE